MMPETTTRRQTVNFLGFLRGQLNGLQGIPTLCYELIQNADDVKDENGNPGATRITFDICDDALYIYNDGVFREIDFERMENVSWGNKREEVGTTGAFGLGFISVYQITDSPEIYSSGRKWQFVPNGREDERIRETRMQTKETKFCLPWAFEESEVRKELGILPISRASLSVFEMQIDRAIESAALFLKQISTLELKRNGRLIRKIQVLRADDKLLLADGTRTIIWRIFEGSFETSANEMRRRYGGIIENKRQSIVKIAVPDDPDVSGLLYAFLPSETATGLPFHINADFYPSPDRKRIIFGDGFKAEWNELSIKCATKILAEQSDEIQAIFSNQNFWAFVERVKKASSKDDLSSEFTHFWELLKPEIMRRRTVLTSTTEVVCPPEAIFLDNKELINAEKIFENLGMNIVHSDLRSHQNLLLETGVQSLKLADIHKSFINNGFNKRCELDQMTEGLRSLDGWETLWSAIENLWNRSYANERQQNLINLKCISIAFGSDGRIWPPEDLLLADQFSQELFSKFSEVVWYQSKSSNHSFLKELVSQFTLVNGIDLLREAENILNERWKENFLSPKEILEWLEKRRSEISNSSVEQIRSLSIWPTAEGELKPLTTLFLAGDFEDPLHLAQLVDLDVLEGGRDFLERVLHVAQLDFIAYVRNWVPTVIRQGEMKFYDRIQLIRILAENLGKLRDDPNIQRTLAELPIVWCGEDKFLKASRVWFDTEEVKNVLGINVNLAKLPTEKIEAVRDFYSWLGVSSKPKPEHIVSKITGIVDQPPDERKFKLIGKLIAYIASKWSSWEDNEKEQFARLRFIEWLPGTKDPSKWFDVPNIYSGYSRHLFESQANFLVVEIVIQRAASDFFKFLEISSEPSPLQVVRHILYCSNKGKPINQEVYANLNRTPDDPAINQLKGKKCLYLKRPNGDEDYFYPYQVLWDQNPYGSYRYRLSPEYGRFKNLFDRIGVKATPDYNDAINVLLEISTKFGEFNPPLPDDTDDEAIIMYCWKQITDALESELITSDEIKRTLGDQKTIPDSRKVLTQPERMFFEDRPGWGRKFQIVKNNLAPRIEGVWIGMEAAGVRPLSTVIRTEMISCENKTPDNTLLNSFHDRINLVQRVVEKHRSQGIKTVNVNEVEKLHFYRADQVSIIRIFIGFNRREESELETVDAILLDGSLYFSAIEENYPWIGIARELSYVIDPNGELSDLGLALSNILSQSVSAARDTLDQFGYPNVETIEVNITEGQTLEPGRELEDLEGIRVPVNHPDAANQAINQPIGNARSITPDGSNASSPGSITGRATNSVQEKRKSSRLRSYVYPEGSLALRSEDAQTNRKRTEVGERGVQKVMQYEREQGRIPKDMDKVQVNHPGYDIESTNPDGSISYIEVKTISGTWDSESPAEVTKFEFETAREKGEAFWLYVVEKVDTEDCRIYQIQNPGLRVDYFLFDHGWMTQTNDKNEPIIS